MTSKITPPLRLLIDISAWQAETQIMSAAERGALPSNLQTGRNRCKKGVSKKRLTRPCSPMHDSLVPKQRGAGVGTRKSQGRLGRASGFFTSVRMVTPVQWRAVWGSRKAGRFLVSGIPTPARFRRPRRKGLRRTSPHTRT